MKINIFPKFLYKKISNMKLKNKINLIILSLIIPIFILMFLSLGNFIITIQDDIERRFQIAEESIKKAIEFYKKQNIITAKMIAGNPTIQNNIMIDDPVKDKESQLKLISKLEFLQKSAKMEFAWLYNGKGQIVARGHDPTDYTFENDEKNPLFKNAMAGDTVYTLEYAEDKILFFKVATPIYGEEDKKIKGICVIGFKNRKDFAPVFATTLREISGVEIVIIAENKLVTTSFGIPLTTDPIEVQTDINSKIINGIEYDIRWILVWDIRYIKNFGVALALDNSKIKTTLMNTVIFMLIIFILVTLLSYALSRKISWNIISSVNNIMKGTEKISQKDFSYRIQIVGGGDELSVLANTFNSMTSTIQDYTQHLEEKVQQRTKELNDSLQETQALKVQQDGDYFLTSLLINPLLVNLTKSDFVGIEFYVSQKKKFHFKNKQYEIGGDVCISDTIELKGKKYTVFTNGDAMGKSLQGAGGALVMGVVFNAYVARTKATQAASFITPERWLKDCFTELQNVFVSFDGSMLISTVVGIVDEATGLMYYFNAEHPWNILYRNKKAEFTQNGLDLRKVGTMGFDLSIKIRLLQLQAGDVLILGSDGRDDILLGIDKNTGGRLINEDETKILFYVEEADGDLKKIVEIITQKGEITDDLSLIKISYKKEPEWKNKLYQPEFIDAKKLATKAFNENKLDEAIKYYKNAINIYPDGNCIKELALCYRKTGNDAAEFDILEKGIWYYPDNLQFIYRAALLAKKLKNYKIAIDYGESYRVYQPLHINNLINLADTYRVLKQYTKFDELLEIIEQNEPNNANLLQLKNLAKSRS